MTVNQLNAISLWCPFYCMRSYYSNTDDDDDDDDFISHLSLNWIWRERFLIPPTMLFRLFPILFHRFDLNGARPNFSCLYLFV
jgi:hypothetical protein